MIHIFCFLSFLWGLHLVIWDSMESISIMYKSQGKLYKQGATREKIPVIVDGVNLGFVLKYYKHGSWIYRGIAILKKGFLAGEFNDLENAIDYIRWKHGV